MILKMLMAGVFILVTSDSPNQDLFHGFGFVKTRQSLGWFVYALSTLL